MRKGRRIQENIIQIEKKGVGLIGANVYSADICSFGQLCIANMVYTANILGKISQNL